MTSPIGDYFWQCPFSGCSTEATGLFLRNDTFKAYLILNWKLPFTINMGGSIRLVSKILFPVRYTGTYLSKPETSKANTALPQCTAHYYFRIYKYIAFPLIRAFCMSVCKFNDKTGRAEQRVFVFAEEELAIAMVIMWSAVRCSRPGTRTYHRS